MKNWHLLHINSNLAAIFWNSAILAFRQNKNLRDIIGTKLIEKGKVKRKSTNNMQGKCTSYLANNRTLCYKQVTNATMFRKNLTNRTFHIYHNVKCKSKYVIYLLECTRCKMQYVGKDETDFSIKLKNHERMYGNQMPDLQVVNFQTNTITSTHVQNSYWLNRYVTSTSTEKFIRKNFWILTLETVMSKALNQELN